MSDWENMFRRKAIIDIHSHKPELPTYQATQQLLVLQTANAPPSAMVHDIQRPTSFLRRVSANGDLLAVSHCDLVVLLFFHPGHRGVTCGHVLLGYRDKVAEGRDVAKHAYIEGFAAHGFEDLGGRCQTVRSR